MYYKTRKFRTEGDKLYVTAAASNIYPYTYSEEEYDPKDIFPTLEAKMMHFFISSLEGNFQPCGSRKLRTLLEAAKSLKSSNIKHTNFCDDLKYRVEQSRKVNEILSMYMLDVYTKRTPNIAFYTKRLHEVDEESKNLYEQIRIERERKGLISIASASISEIFDGYDVLCDINYNIYLAKREKYDNRGILDNGDGSAILVEEGTSFRAGNAYTALSTGCKSHKPSLNWSLFEGMTMKKLPFEGFEPEKYGIIYNPPKTFYVTYKVEGRYVAEVEAYDLDEARRKAVDKWQGANFGRLEDIDGEDIIVEDQDGNYVWER